MSDDYVNKEERDYNELIAEHARLTIQVVRLERVGEERVRDEDKIQGVEEKRMAVHRELERLGLERGKTILDVQMDVLAYQYNLPELGIVGLHAIPMKLRDTTNTYRAGHQLSTDFQKSPYYSHGRGNSGDNYVVIAFDESFSTTEDDAYSFGNEWPFREWLEEKANVLCKALARKFPDQKIHIVEINNDGEMMSHAESVLIRGIVVPGPLLETVVGWIKVNREAWVSEAEYRKRQETFVQWSDIGRQEWALSADQIPGSLMSDTRRQIERFSERFVSASQEALREVAKVNRWRVNQRKPWTHNDPVEPSLLASLKRRSGNSLKIVAKAGSESVRITFYLDYATRKAGASFDRIDEALRFLEQELEVVREWTNRVDLAWEMKDRHGDVTVYNPESTAQDYHGHDFSFRWPVGFPSEYADVIKTSFDELRDVRVSRFRIPSPPKNAEFERAPLLTSEELIFTFRRQNGEWLGSMHGRDTNDEQTIPRTPLAAFVSKLEASIRETRDWVNEAERMITEERQEAQAERREEEGIATERTLAEKRPSARPRR